MRPKGRVCLEEDGLPVLRTLFAGALALVLTAPLPAQSADIPQEPSDAAVTFAAGFSADQLSGMLSRIGARQPQMMALGQMDGSTLAAVFDAEIARAVQKYSDQWQQNMARAWTPLMTEDELTSLTAEGAQSPHVDKYLKLREEAGQNMQAISGDLFKQILKEVMQNTINALAPSETTQ